MHVLYFGSMCVCLMIRVLEPVSIQMGKNWDQMPYSNLREGSLDHMRVNIIGSNVYSEAIALTGEKRLLQIEKLY